MPPLKNVVVDIEDKKKEALLHSLLHSTVQKLVDAYLKLEYLKTTESPELT
jgi:hypothetical protein